MKTFKHNVGILIMLLLIPLVSCDFFGKDDEEVICKVTVSSYEGGEASVSTSEVIKGETVTLMARPDNGYIFSYWTVKGNIVSYENPYTAKVLSDTEYFANFKKENGGADFDIIEPEVVEGEDFFIEINKEEGQYSTYIQRNNVTIISIPNPGYEFECYRIGDKVVSTNSTFMIDIEELTYITVVFKSIASDKYVDLGLSVKWATCNLGADSPEEYGDYYAWGETSPKDAFYWNSYKFSNGDKITKYLTKSEYGVVDNKTVLEKSDDAAYANLKGSWRMPTKAEYEELKENCTWEFIYQNGVYGAKATSMKNGNTIFFPCAGFNDEGVFKSVGTLGGYWASSLHLGYNDVGYGLYLESENIDCGPISIRSSGLSVRAVCP